MSKPFNLTARLNVVGPFGTKPIIDKLRRNLGDINVKINVQVNRESNARLRELNALLAETQARLKGIESSSAIVSAGLSKVDKSLGTASKSAKNTAKATAEMNVVMAKTAKGAAEVASELQEFGRISGLAVRRFTGFTVATGVIFGFINAVKQGVSEAVEFEREMVRVAQVTGRTLAGIAPLEREIRRLAVTFGVAATDLGLAARTISQAGFASSEARVALEALAKTTLAPTFRDITNTTEGAIAILRQFKLDARDLESVLGSVNAVASRFAVESEDIIGAIRRAGGVFAAAANPQSAAQAKRTVQEFIALFTSVRATTRESAESIATGLRTIFTRLQRRSTIEALKDLNVELQKGGKFIGPFKAIEALNKELGKLDPRDIRFSEIVEQLGGFRQVGKVIPLILRFKDAQKALSVTLEGQDSLTKDAAFAQQSLAVKLAKTREEFKKLIDEITKSKTFKTLADSFLLISNTLIKVGKGIKGILPAITILGAVKSVGVLSNLFRGFRVGVTATAGRAKSETKQTRTEAAIDANTQAIEESTKTTKESDANSKRDLSKALSDNTVALTNLTTAISKLIVQLGGMPTPVKRQKGGIIPGYGRGDKVPLMAEPGEFVLSRDAVKRAGLGALIKFNSGGKTKPPFPIEGFKPVIRGRDAGIGNVGSKKQALLQKIDFLNAKKDAGTISPAEEEILKVLLARIKQINASRTQRFARKLNLHQFQSGGRKGPNQSILEKILSGAGSRAEFEKVLGKDEVAKIASQYGLKSKQVRRTPSELASPEKQQAIIQAFKAIEAKALEKARSFDKQEKTRVSELPQFVGRGGGPGVAGVFAERITGADPKLNRVVKDGAVLSILSAAGLIPPGTREIVMPVATAFVDPQKSKVLVKNIKENIAAGTASVASILKQSPFDPNNPLISRLIAKEGIDLSDAAGKLFEAGIKAGLGLDNEKSSLDFPTIQQVGALRTLFDIPGSVVAADAKFRNTSDSYASIRQEYARFLSAKKSPRKRLAHGGTGAPNSLLTPGELVFDSKATSEAGLSALRKFNKTGDISGLGPIRSGNIFRVPGSGSTDSVPANLETNSFVIRKSSAKRFASGGLARFADGGPTPSLNDINKQINSRLNLVIANIVRALEKGGRAAEVYAKRLGVSQKELGKFVAERKGGRQGDVNILRRVEGLVAGKVIGSTEREQKIVRETFGTPGISREDVIRRSRQAVRGEREAGLRGGGVRTSRILIDGNVILEARNLSLSRQVERTIKSEREALRAKKNRLDVISFEDLPDRRLDIPLVGATAEPGPGPRRRRRRGRRGPTRQVQDILDIAPQRETGIRRRELEVSFARLQRSGRRDAAAAQTRNIVEFARTRGPQAGAGLASQAAKRAYEKAIQAGATTEVALNKARSAVLAVLRAQQNAKRRVLEAEKKLAEAIKNEGRLSRAAAQARKQLTQAQRQLANTLGKEGTAGLRNAFRAGGIKGLAGSLGARAKGLVGGPQALTGIFAASTLLESIQTKTSGAAAIKSGISGGLSGAITGFQLGGPIGGAVGAIVGAGASAINAAQDKRMEIAQESLIKSTTKLDSSFAQIEKEATASALKEFNRSLGGVIQSVSELDKVYKQETEVVGSFGSTVAGILNLNIRDIFGGQAGRQRASTRRLVGAEAGVFKVLSLEIRKAIGTQGVVRNANREEAQILESRFNRITREQFKNLNPAAQKAASIFEKRLATELEGADLANLGKFGISSLVSQQLERFTKDSDKAVQTLVALDFEKFEKIRPQLDAAGEGTKEYADILRKAGREVLEARVREQVAVARVSSVINQNIKDIERTAEAISKIGQAAQIATKDMDVALSNLSDIQSVFTGGKVGFGQVINPFENVQFRSTRQINEGIAAIARAGGGRIGGPLSNARQAVFETRRIEQNLAEVLKDAVNEAQRSGGTLSVEEAVKAAIRGDKRLAGVSEETRRDLLSRFTGVFTNRQTGGAQNFKQALKTIDDISKAFIGQSKTTVKSLAEVFGAIVSTNQKLAQATNQFVSIIQSANSKFDQAFKLANKVQLDIAKLQGGRIGPEDIRANQNRLLLRLTGRAGVNRGAGTTDVALIGRSIAALQDAILRDRQQLQKVVGDPQKTEFLTQRIAENTLRMGDLRQALDAVASSTDELSAIQNRLAEIQQKRDASRNLLEKLSRASFDPNAARDINRAIQDAFNLLAGRGAGVNGGAAFLQELASVMGPEVQREVQVAVDRARLASLGGPAAKNNPLVAFIKRFLVRGGAGVRRGQRPEEKLLIEQFRKVSNNQIRAINIQGQLVARATFSVRDEIIKMREDQNDRLEALIRRGGGIGRRDGGFIKGPFKGNRDTEIIKLVPGEFVVRRNVAQKFGKELSMLNRGIPVDRAFGLEGFAGGGGVGSRQLARKRQFAENLQRVRKARNIIFDAQNRQFTKRGRFEQLVGQFKKRGFDTKTAKERARKEINELSSLYSLGKKRVKDMRGNIVPVASVFRLFNNILRNNFKWATITNRIRRGLKGLNLQTPEGRRRYRINFEREFKAAGLDTLPVRPKQPLLDVVNRIMTGKISQFGRNNLEPSISIWKKGGLRGAEFFKTRLTKTPQIVPGSLDEEKRWLNSPIGRFREGGFAGVVPGEFVVNRNAASKNAGFLQHLNSTGQVPGFQTGGVVSNIVSPTISVGGRAPSLNNISSAISQLSIALGGLSSFARFATQLQQASQNLQNINIPERITMEVAPMQVNVVINGAEALANMQDSLRDMVTSEISAALSRHINVITGETNENFVRL